MLIYIGESDTWRGRSLYMAILETLRKAGLSGATVMRGLAGFGAHSLIHSSTILRLSIDLPVIITVIDIPENIDRALALVRPMVREGLITIEDVQIVQYSHRYLQPLPADSPVADIMTREVTSVRVDTPAVEIVELLLGSKMFKAVPVVDDQQHVVGIVSDGDLLRQAGMPARLSIGRRLDDADLKGFLAQVRSEKTASDIMTSSVFIVPQDMELGRAVHQMVERNLKRVPVVDQQGRLAGMLTRLDVLRAATGDGKGEPEQASLPGTGRTLGELMSRDVPVAYVMDDLIDVLQKILRSGIKRVVVLDERGAVAGIITDGDLVARVEPVIRRNVLQSFIRRVVSKDLWRGKITARELMSAGVLLGTSDMPITEAINLMLQEGRKRIVVVDEQQRPVGIVDRQTLMAASLGYLPANDS